MAKHLHTSIQSGKRPDCVVVGAGVFGLWAARHALKHGEGVLVIEKRRVGAGASGGFLGSLMPHMPDRWNAKKQFQYRALVSLEQAIGELEAETGFDCGYRRCGRLMPLRHERMLAHVGERIAGARAHWLDGNGQPAFSMEHVPPEDMAKRFPGLDGNAWLNPAMAPFGGQFDTLSARVNPRAYLSALAAYVEGHPDGEVREGAEVVMATGRDGGVEVALDDGTRLAAGRVVIANGWEAYGLIGRLDGGRGAILGGHKISGRGVKGQAALLELEHEDRLPIVYEGGSYIVPHGRAMGQGDNGGANRVAVGSTSVDDWLPHGLADDSPEPDHASESFAGEVVEGDRLAAKLTEAIATRFDPSDTGFLNHAAELVPALGRARIVERWANVRPRNTMIDPATGKPISEPCAGALDHHQAIAVAIGGFKIGFGVAHLATENIALQIDSYRF